MIARLRGTLAHKALDHVVVDVGGVGYHVVVSSQTLAELPAVGEPATVLCHTHVREDALLLFGFREAAERETFQALIGVSGVGPKLAVTILSGMPQSTLVQTIAAGDAKRLQSIPGVGKKTAERLVVDLKDRFAKLAGQTSEAAAGSLSPVAEVIEAMVNLGYKRPKAERAIAQAFKKLGENAAPEALLRLGLALIQEL